jgi:hypothetical protein
VGEGDEDVTDVAFFTARNSPFPRTTTAVHMAAAYVTPRGPRCCGPRARACVRDCIHAPTSGAPLDRRYEPKWDSKCQLGGFYAAGGELCGNFVKVSYRRESTSATLIPLTPTPTILGEL